MEKLAAMLICMALLACTLGSCTSSGSGTASSGSAGSGTGEKLSIVTTIFPEYDWVLNILGEKAADADVCQLLDSGVDLHSYQPTADDIVRLTDADLVICTGGESEAWAEEALQENASPDRRVVRLLDCLGDRVREEETVEGMEEEEEEEEAEEGPEYDEHVWLSLKNTALICGEIRDALCELDPENSDTYTANAETYLGKVNELEARCQEVVDGSAHKPLLFGDRFPFRYLTEDYGLEYFAAFPGCSAETEASFETIAFLAGKVDELGLDTVLTLEETEPDIARTIIDTTQSKSAQILTMDSMQSAGPEDRDSGVTWLSIMEQNLEVLDEALG